MHEHMIVSSIMLERMIESSIVHEQMIMSSIMHERMIMFSIMHEQMIMHERILIEVAVVFWFILSATEGSGSSERNS